MVQFLRNIWKLSHLYKSICAINGSRPRFRAIPTPPMAPRPGSVGSDLSSAPQPPIARDNVGRSHRGRAYQIRLWLRGTQSTPTPALRKPRHSSELPPPPVAAGFSRDRQGSGPDPRGNFSFQPRLWANSILAGRSPAQIVRLKGVTHHVPQIIPETHRSQSA